jgi:hypothetical protein
VNETAERLMDPAGAVARPLTAALEEFASTAKRDHVIEPQTGLSEVCQ